MTEAEARRLALVWDSMRDKTQALCPDGLTLDTHEARVLPPCLERDGWAVEITTCYRDPATNLRVAWWLYPFDVEALHPFVARIQHDLPSRAARVKEMAAA